MLTPLELVIHTMNDTNLLTCGITIPPALNDLIRLEENQIYLHSTNQSVAN
jgi:hypothetical protein